MTSSLTHLDLASDFGFEPIDEPVSLSVRLWSESSPNFSPAKLRVPTLVMLLLLILLFVHQFVRLFVFSLFYDEFELSFYSSVDSCRRY